MRVPPFVAVSLLVVSACAFPQSARPETPERASGGTDKRAVAGRGFMVGGALPLGVDAVFSIWRRGGTGVDAAVAVQLVLNLVEPQSSGIGGGGFMLVHDASRNKLIAY